MSRVNPIRNTLLGGAIGTFGASCTVAALEEVKIKNFLQDSFRKAKTIPNDELKPTLLQKTKDVLKGTTNVINGTPQKLKSFIFNKEYKNHRAMIIGAAILGCICGIISSIAIAAHKTEKSLKDPS